MNLNGESEKSHFLMKIFQRRFPMLVGLKGIFLCGYVCRGKPARSAIRWHPIRSFEKFF